MSALRSALAWSRRIALAAGIAAFVALVGTQYARMIAKNVALARTLASTQADIDTLEQRRAEQDRAIRRLSDPRGAIPEIHEKLRLVGDHEAIIYIKTHDDGP